MERNYCLYNFHSRISTFPIVEIAFEGFDSLMTASDSLGTTQHPHVLETRCLHSFFRKPSTFILKDAKTPSNKSILHFKNVKSRGKSGALSKKFLRLKAKQSKLLTSIVASRGFPYTACCDQRMLIKI